ncbi:MAG: hypothetical protein Q9160_007565 [Pyrenula sp. 1 TL-2023]
MPRLSTLSLTAIGGAISLSFLAQQCQCPPVAIPPITSAALQTAAALGSAGASFAGAVIGANHQGKGGHHRARQAFIAPPDVPQQEFDRCYNDLSQPATHVYVQGPVSHNGIQVDGLPASCMNLATVIDDDAAGGPPPIACGSACLLYDNLSDDDYNNMGAIFDKLKNA